MFIYCQFRRKFVEKSIITLKDISVSFDGEIILPNLNLTVKDKEFVTFLGPSGCGKTTTLRIIGGFLQPNSGQVFFDGEDITQLPPHKRRINTVFQRYALFPHLNVEENIAFGLKIQKLSKSEISKRVEHLLKVVNLEGFQKRKIHQLSGGQQQRVAIARALVNYPKVLLLDEPLGALDLKLRKEMQLELKRMQQQLETTFIYVTHDQEEALTMSDSVVVMNEGEIQQIGSPEDIYNEPRNAFVADFIGESNILNGIMHKDFSVEFAGRVFDCVDKGFKPMQRVDVVVRPEDITISDIDKSNIKGVVESVVFKGVHYEIEVSAADIYWIIHTTKSAKVGDKVGLNFGPNDIHVMRKMFDRTTNQIPATVESENTISFLGTSFAKKDLNIPVGKEVVLTISPKDVQIVSSDHSDVVLYLESLIYKGSYNEMLFYIEDMDDYLLVHSENEEEVGTDLGLKFDFDKIQITPAEEKTQ